MLGAVALVWRLRAEPRHQGVETHTPASAVPSRLGQNGPTAPGKVPVHEQVDLPYACSEVSNYSRKSGSDISFLQCHLGKSGLHVGPFPFEADTLYLAMIVKRPCNWRCGAVYSPG